MANNSIPPFCSKTGQPHSELNPSFRFCPNCSAQLSPTTPVRAKPEVIELDCTPKHEATEALSKAIFVPAAETQARRVLPPPVTSVAKASNRTAAEVARQNSIQKTQPTQIRTAITTQLYVIATIVLVRKLKVQEENFERIKILSYDVLCKTTINVSNRRINSLDAFIDDCILNEVQRFDSTSFVRYPRFLATELTKDGPVYLPKSVEESRTTKELLECGLFRKTASNFLQVFITYEQIEEDDAFECTELSQVKKEKEIKKEKIRKKKKVVQARTAVVKKESAIKKEASTPFVRKRGISQVEISEIDDDEDLLDLQSLSTTSGYALRSKDEIS